MIFDSSAQQSSGSSTLLWCIEDTKKFLVRNSVAVGDMSETATVLCFLILTTKWAMKLTNFALQSLSLLVLFFVPQLSNLFYHQHWGQIVIIDELGFWAWVIILFNRCIAEFLAKQFAHRQTIDLVRYDKCYEQLIIHFGLVIVICDLVIFIYHLFIFIFILSLALGCSFVWW